jgi:uncharacterized protein (TIGR00730 family)
MHQRKSLMAERADAFLALPGGIGTFEELFEAWTWAQLGIHAKPVGCLNVAGFYDKLAQFLDHATDEKFLKPVHRSTLVIESDPQVLLTKLRDTPVPYIPKWLDKIVPKAPEK